MEFQVFKAGSDFILIPNPSRDITICVFLERLLAFRENMPLSEPFHGENIMLERFISTICLSAALVFSVIPSLLAVDLNSDRVFLWDVLPQQTQGENGIRLQSRSLDPSNYADLTYHADYDWWTSGAPFNVPRIAREEPGEILAHPSAVQQCLSDADAVVRVVLEGDYSHVAIQGATDFRAGGSGTGRFTIYKGENNWNNPLWEGGPNESFALLEPFAEGDEYFFATNAVGNDVNDWMRWKDVSFQGVPEPGTWCLLTFSSFFLILHKVIARRRKGAGMGDDVGNVAD